MKNKEKKVEVSKGKSMRHKKGHRNPYFLNAANQRGTYLASQACVSETLSISPRTADSKKAISKS